MVIGEIAQRIQLMRDQRVVLDIDLAAFYGETTKRFNQQVNRNRERFPEDFLFQLNEEEFANLRLQFATSSLKGGHGGLRYAPLAFTRKVSTHERNIAELADSMAQLLHTPPDPPKRSIGFITHEDKPGKPASTKAKTAGKKA